MRISEKIKEKLNALPIFCFILNFIKTLCKRISNDRITVESSHLAYVTLLSLVPMLTVLFSILSVLPVLEQQKLSLKEFVFTHFVPAMSEVIQEHLDEFSSNASNTTIVGVVSLFAVSMLLIRSVDISLNHIWKVKQKRNPVTTFSVYWLVITLGPLLFGTSLAMSSYFFSLRFEDNMNIMAIVQKYTLKYLPILFSFVGLFLMYSVVPIRKLKIKYAAVGALIASIMFEFGKKLFSWYIIYVPTYQNIYGALAVIPILLLWIYCSWLIVFFGAEIHATLQTIYDKRNAEETVKVDNEEQEEFNLSDS